MTGAAETAPLKLAAALGEPVDEAVRLTKGLFNECWKVRCAGRCLLVKFRVAADAEERFRRVARIAAEVRRVGLLTPAVLAVGRSGDDDEAYAVHEWIDGQDAEDYLAGADQTATCGFFTRLGRVVAALHRIPTAGLPVVDPPLPRAAGDLAAAYDRGLIGDAEAAAASHLLHRHRPSGRYAGLAHRDLHLPNVLVTPDGTVGLLDFDHSGGGDPLEDFVKLRCWVFEDDAAKADAFEAGYTSVAGPLPADAEDRLVFFGLATCAAYLVYSSEKEPQHLAEWQERFAGILAGQTAGLVVSGGSRC
jgi:aminoglycoside phosphotransferase (APT) family kinase protein